jgi:hypothetical protein
VSVLPLGEARELARIMGHMNSMPDRDVKDRAAAEALLGRGLVVHGAAGWRVTDAGARAYVEGCCAAIGVRSPWPEGAPPS